MNRFMLIVPPPDYRPSSHRLTRLACNVALIGMLLSLSGGPLEAHTSRRVALNSNIVIDGDRVIFAQGTGSLTVLDLASGKTLLRKKPEADSFYSGNLQRSAYGVLMMTYDSIVLL